MQLKEKIWSDPDLVSTLMNGGVAVMPTDTLYGIVGYAGRPDTVARIYELRKRNPDKPCIILIGSEDDLRHFSIALSQKQKNILKDIWPGPVSVILDCPDDRLGYLHRWTNTLAFRIPKPEGLRELLKKTGPLIAPSANIEGEQPAKNIEEARKYFGDRVDLYVDGGEVEGQASKIIRLYNNGELIIIRQ